MAISAKSQLVRAFTGIQTKGEINNAANIIQAGLNNPDGILGLAANGYVKRTGAGTYAVSTGPDEILGTSTNGYVKRTGAETYGISAGPDEIIGTSSNGYVRRTGAETYTADAAGQLIGTATNDNAAAGFIGEYIDSTIITTAGTQTSGVSKNITNISLTAGDWDVFGFGGIKGVTDTAISYLAAGSSNTTNTLSGDIYEFLTNSTTINTSWMYFVFPTTRWSLASTTTIFLVCNCIFINTAPKGYGRIEARRVR